MRDAEGGGEAAGAGKREASETVRLLYAGMLIPRKGGGGVFEVVWGGWGVKITCGEVTVQEVFTVHDSSLFTL